MPEVITEVLPPACWPAAQDFYSRVGYHAQIAPDSVVVGAKVDAKIIGAVRLCTEENDLLLRGMMIDPAWQRQGIGTLMIRQLEKHIDHRDCYCLPHDWLRGFYGQVGFREISPAAAPTHLQARYQLYRNGPYPHIIIMKREF